MFEFKLPAIGEGVVEGEIVRWLKQPGDSVAANEPVVEVMTDKATVEIPSPLAAILQEIRAEEGVIAEVGEVIAVFGTSDSPAPTPPRSEPAEAAKAAPAPAPSKTKSNGSGRVLATPAARALARESGVDLKDVPGDRGRITKGDVERHHAEAARRDTVVLDPPAGQEPVESPSKTPTVAPSTTAPAPPLASSEDERIPFRGLRRRIAEGMAKSYFTAVHYTYVEQVNVTKLVEIRKQAKAAAADAGVQLSYLPFIVKAAIRGLKRYPMVNSWLDEDASQIVLRKNYNIGIATATDNGLIVPVVHNADRLSLLDVAAEIQRVSVAAREGKASLQEVTGSTFTITSLGAIGGVLATPILNYPEVGVIGVHAIRKTPIVDDDDNITVGHLMNLSVSLDHRVVDGFEGASFLQEVKRYLEDPTLLLLTGI